MRDIQNLPDDGHLYAAHVIHDIWRTTEGQAIVVTDVGQHQMWEAQYYKRSPSRWITSGGLGTMGFALPAAIGAKMARPGREVWAIVGDGGFQMTQAELRRCAGELEVNDRDHQQRLPRHGAAVAAVLPRSPLLGDADVRPDFVKLADAHGITGAAATRAEVDAIRRRARRGAVLIDFRVQQEDTVYPMVPPAPTCTR